MRGSEADVRTEVAEMNPTKDLDDVVHQRVRLGILTAVFEARRVDFNYLKEILFVTKGNLSQHLRVLEDAGFVVIDKVIEGRKPRTWISITRRGRRALRQEVTSLRIIVSRVDRLLLLAPLLSILLPAAVLVGACCLGAHCRLRETAPTGLGYGDDAEPGRVLASDFERDDALALISDALGEGRLNLDEAEQRIDAALHSRHRDQLAELLHDLPG